MGIRVSWDEQYTHIIHLTVTGAWLWDEFYTAMNLMHKEMDASPHGKIDFIVDMREGQILPQNILTRMQQVSTHHHPKSGTMVVVGAGAFATMLFSIMAKLLPQRMQYVHLVDTTDEAYTIILEKNAQLS